MLHASNIYGMYEVHGFWGVGKSLKVLHISGIALHVKIQSLGVVLIMILNHTER